MGFLVIEPHTGVKAVQTSQSILTQTWQDLEQIRFDAGGADTASFVDQAKHYFVDAARSDWRSAGLLYYYSFLNLSKALLLIRGLLDFQQLRTASAYHGLTAGTQTIGSIEQYEVEIQMKLSTRGLPNIFPMLYEAVINEPWPFTQPVRISLQEIASHSVDLGNEFRTLFGIHSKLNVLQSLIRIENNHAWFEAAVPNGAVPGLQAALPNWTTTAVPLAVMSPSDEGDWLFALARTKASLRDHALVRGPMAPNAQLQQVGTEAATHFQKIALPTYFEAVEGRHYWLFCPKLTLHGTLLHWHPILTDYITAFALSQILRYHPHLLDHGSPSSFLAKAWCNQSALTALRYFLMLSTNPGVRISAVN